VGLSGSDPLVASSIQHDDELSISEILNYLFLGKNGREFPVQYEFHEHVVGEF